MKMIDVLLAEMDQEAQSTARVLERVPQAQLSWRPHPKSLSLGQLALHVATIPGNVAELAAQTTIPEPPQFIQAEAATAAELVPALKASLAKARAGARRHGRCEADGDVAVDERRQGTDGDAARRRDPHDHAEPLVSPSRPAAGLPAHAQRAAAVGVRPDRGRESVRRRDDGAANTRSTPLRLQAMMIACAGTSGSRNRPPDARAGHERRALPPRHRQPPEPPHSVSRSLRRAPARARPSTSVGAARQVPDRRAVVGRVADHASRHVGLVPRRRDRRSLARSRSARSRRVRDVVGTDACSSTIRAALASWISPRPAQLARVSVAAARWDPSRCRRSSMRVALARACKGKKVSLKVALLDQRIVAGLGNIYASEALHHARLSPLKKASTIATASGAPKACGDPPRGIDQGRADERDQASRITVPIGAIPRLRT